MRNNKLTVVGILAALVLTAVCGVASRTMAQDLVKAIFTLTEETRFGNTVFPAGQYTLLVEPISQLRPVGSPVAITVRSETTAAPFASVLATASQDSCDRDQLKVVDRRWICGAVDVPRKAGADATFRWFSLEREPPVDSSKQACVGHDESRAPFTSRMDRLRSYSWRKAITGTTRTARQRNAAGQEGDSCNRPPKKLAI